MKLSARSKYGVKACFVLALNYGEVTSVNKLTEETGASQKYLEQIIKILKDNDIVVATRGVSGGYMLSRSPKDITMLQIVKPLEGDFNLTDCIKDGGCSCGCPSFNLWSKLYDGISNVLDNITLESLSSEYRSANRSCSCNKSE